MSKVDVMCLLAFILLLPNIILLKATIPLTLDIYDDGSISLSGSLSQSYYSEEEGSVLTLVDVYEDKFHIKTILQVNTTETLPHIAMTIHAKRGSVDSKAKWSINGSISIRDENGNLTIVIEKLDTISDNYLINITGGINITASGSYAFMFFYFPLLNEEFIKLILERNNITGVDIKALKITKGDNSLKVIFEITLDVQKLLESNRTAIKEVSESSKIPIVLDLNARLIYNYVYVNADLGVYSNINDVLTTLVDIIESSKKLIEGQLFNAIPLGEHYLLTLWTLKEFAETFSILPSSSYFKIMMKGNTTSISFKTPKIIKRGSNNASETIRALYDLILNITERLEKAKCTGINASDILNTAIELRPAENVEVFLKGSRVSSVKLSDLPYLEIRVKKYISSMSKTIMGAAISALITTVAILMLRRKHIISFI